MGCSVGLIIGLLMGTSRKIYVACEFSVEFFRSLPVTALFPLFLLIFGEGDKCKGAMVFTATIFVVLINTAYGVFHAPKERIRMAKIFGASRVQIFYHITFFGALPQILIGIRTSLSLSFIVVIISEMFIGAEHGVGQRIYDAYNYNLTSDLYAIVLFLGIVGYISNKLVILVERRVANWAIR